MRARIRSVGRLHQPLPAAAADDLRRAHAGRTHEGRGRGRARRRRRRLARGRQGRGRGRDETLGRAAALQHRLIEEHARRLFKELRTGPPAGRPSSSGSATPSSRSPRRKSATSEAASVMTEAGFAGTPKNEKGSDVYANFVAPTTRPTTRCGAGGDRCHHTPGAARPVRLVDVLVLHGRRAPAERREPTLSKRLHGFVGAGRTLPRPCRRRRRFARREAREEHPEGHKPAPGRTLLLAGRARCRWSSCAGGCSTATSSTGASSRRLRRRAGAGRLRFLRRGAGLARIAAASTKGHEAVSRLSGTLF